MTVVLDTADIDEVNETFSGMYSRMRLTVTGGEHHARIAREVVGDAELHRTTVTMRFDAQVEPLGTLLFARALNGTVKYESRGRSSTYAPHDVFLMARPDEPHRVAVDGLDVEFVVLPVGRIAKTAGALTGHTAAPVGFLAYRAFGSAAERWIRCLDFVRGTASATAGNPLLAETISGLLASTALATFPNTATEAAIGDRRDARPLTVRRAVAFIEENAHRPIGLADIAAAARVTGRAVQLAFRRHLDTTPMRYLRRVRLDYARQDLRTAEAGYSSAVAARWGFSSSRSFAAAYRRSDGVTPQTQREGDS